MGRWFRFFFGTPQRFLGTMVGVGVVFCLFQPGVFANALQNSITAIGHALAAGINELCVAFEPLLQPILTILIVFAGIRFILFGRTGGGKKR